MAMNNSEFENSIRLDERERCAKIANECEAERFRQPCGGLSDEWMEGFQAGCQFTASAIRAR